MSFSTQLWEKYYTDALASLYNPFVVGIANGTLRKKAFVEYIQQDSIYLEVYEKAYKKAAELAHAAGQLEFEKQIVELMEGIRGELEKHKQRAAERGEKIEQNALLRATKDYTDLLNKACSEGSLVDIVCAICPCSKLYLFIGSEIKRAIPDHNHEYSEWINVYAGDGVNTSAILERMIDALITEETKASAEFYYAEAMRLEFEFFLQQNNVFAAPTTKIFCVVAGCGCHGCETECSHVSEGKVDKAGLCAFVSNLPNHTCRDCKCCDEMNAWNAKIREMSVEYGKTVVDIEDFTSKKESEVTCGFGSFLELPKLLETDLPILIAPSASEITAVESYGYKVRRLFTGMATPLDELPKDTVFFVDHIFEVGMALMGTAFYPNQHFDTLPTTLIIAGSDSGGGAGMQADMKACCALGTVTVFTAITAQNSRGAQNIYLLPLEWIETQIDSVMQDFHIDCVKTGMLGSKEVAHLVARKMEEYKVKNFVCDPCMVCRAGTKIMAEDAVPVVKSELIPKALIITPNYFEAQTMLGHAIPHTVEGIKAAARELQALGCPNVYVKGGPVGNMDEACDVFCYEDGKVEVFMVPYVQSRNTHGTGCTIASSIAAGISKGLSVYEAVKEAKEYVNGAVIDSRFLHLGKGKQGPLNHLYRTFPSIHH